MMCGDEDLSFVDENDVEDFEEYTEYYQIKDYEDEQGDPEELDFS